VREGGGRPAAKLGAWGLFLAGRASTILVGGTYTCGEGVGCIVSVVGGEDFEDPP